MPPTVLPVCPFHYLVDRISVLTIFRLFDQAEQGLWDGTRTWKFRITPRCWWNESSSDQVQEPRTIGLGSYRRTGNFLLPEKGQGVQVRRLKLWKKKITAFCRYRRNIFYCHSSTKSIPGRCIYMMMMMMIPCRVLSMRINTSMDSS